MNTMEILIGAASTSDKYMSPNNVSYIIDNSKTVVLLLSVEQ